MALHVENFNLQNGLTVPDAYIRVDSFNGSKSEIQYSVNVYVSEEAFRGSSALSPQPYLEQILINMALDTSENAAQMFEQVYAHLKTQDRFTTAIDV